MRLFQKTQTIVRLAVLSVIAGAAALSEAQPTNLLYVPPNG